VRVPPYVGGVNHRRWLPAWVVVLIAAAGCAAEEDQDPPDAAPSSAAPRVEEPDTLAPDPSPEPSVPPLRRARTPGELVDQIVTAERAIADPATPARALAAAGHLQQLAYRVLGTRPAWDRKVLRAVPERLVPVVSGNVASRREFRSMHTDLSPTLPAWRIVPPAPARDLLSYYRAAEREFGVGWEYLAAINLVETGMGRIRGTSVAGAQGPMQFIPTTWARWGRGDINSPRDAIMAAARYLAANGFTRRGGIPGALWRYNNHSAYVRGVTLLARRMERDPRAFFGYYHWQVYYLTTEGDVLLPEGYETTRPIPVKRWLERHPR
jgi:transglycosylase-like protein with SLT domain